jgi:hypothetical protein
MILVILTIFCLLFTACQKEDACIHQNITTSVEKAETCVEYGILSHRCENCGVTFVQTTPTGQHIFTETVTQEATCAEEGILTVTCTLCGETEEKYIPSVV